MDNTLTIASFNCRGLGDFYKRRDTFHFLREKQFSIYLLQDTHFTPELEDRIKREWGFDAYFSSYNSNSRGVAILINSNIEYKLVNVSKDINGNILVLCIKAFDKEFVIVNIYGPNDDRPNFYENVIEMIEATGITDNVIIGGDYNLVLNFELDCYNYRRRNNVNASNKVVDLIHSFDLLDIWREMNPDRKRYTWRRSTPFQQSRLDFFLISSILSPLVKKTDIIPGYRSDHSLITLTLQFGEEGKRSQFWKFNTSLLSDKTYLDEINKTIIEVISEYAVFPYNRDNLDTISSLDVELTINDQLFLDVLLMKIRSKTISYASYKKRKFEETERQLLLEIENLEKKETLNNLEQDTLKAKHEELVNIRDFRLRGVLLRSRARWVEDGEKVSSYFCSLEKRNYVNKCMSKITLNNDTSVTDKKEIVNEVSKFYKLLYTKRDVRDAAFSDLVNNIPKLSDLEAEQLEGLLTLDELSLSLKNMKNGKSPGSDGFPSEFFKVFWRQLGGFVLRSLNEGFRKGEMSNTQREGVVVCLPKTENDRDRIKNWRPITLLNTVYKIGSSAIADRLKTILPKIINEDQTGFVKNRFIGDNIRLIYDTISYLTENNKPGLLLCLDFEKAFDSLDWGFLHKVLEGFGFKNDICSWVKTFYSNIRSTVSMNGLISDWFSVTRGCRQGDPISPYLFILCAEIMGCMIRENNNIKGIKIEDKEIKLTQYADDSEILMDGDRQSFEETILSVQRFGEISGLSLNTKKTTSIWLGNSRNSPIRYMQHLDINWNPRQFKILGIWFTNDLYDCIEINYNDKMSEIRRLYKVWSKRQITPLGRIAILKSLILSKLIYLWLLLPNPPNRIVDEIQKDIYKFVWNNKLDRINRKTSVKNLNKGGIGIPDVCIYMNALKITWIRKLIHSTHKWKTYLYCSCPILKNIEDIGPDIPMQNVNIFWKDVFKAYSDFNKGMLVSDSSDFLAEPIFYNKKLTIDRKVIFNETWFANGVKKVKDFFDANGQMLTLDEFNNKYSLNQQQYLFYNRCLDTIRQYKRKCNIQVTNNLCNEKNLVLQKLYSIPKGAKCFYDCFLEFSKVTPKFCDKWNNKLETEVNWSKVFENVTKTKEIKLRWFQIRINTRIICTNITLLAMGLKQDDLCTFCNEERESIEHIFTDCEPVIQFLNSVKSLLLDHEIVDNRFTFDNELILFGYTNTCFKIDDALLYFVQILIYFIYKSRCEQVLPIFNSFKQYFMKKYVTLKFIAMKNYTLDKFEKTWSKWENLVEN